MVIILDREYSSFGFCFIFTNAGQKEALQKQNCLPLLKHALTEESIVASLLKNNRLFVFIPSLF
jgi:hypothetical protein